MKNSFYCEPKLSITLSRKICPISKRRNIAKHNPEKEVIIVVSIFCCSVFVETVKGHKLVKKAMMRSKYK